MKANRYLIAGLLVIGVAAGVVGIWSAGRYALDQISGVDRSLHRQHESVNVGMVREEVVRRMGQPKREVSDFYLPAASGYETEYLRAQTSGAAYYLYWESSSGWDAQTYVVGFATNNTVRFKSRGTSDPPKARS